MSIITCKVTDTGYEVAADSIIIWNDLQSKGENFEHVKLVDVNGMVLGGSGAIAESSMFQLFISNHRPAHITELGILEFLTEFVAWKRSKTGGDGIANHYFLGFDRVVFLIEGWLVSQIRKYHAIGAGREYALAALYLGHDAKTAAKVATELSIYCEPPIVSIKKEF
jgi:hypothetical protein